jgi:transcriptional regulator of acetoin/glycerol metabolism
VLGTSGDCIAKTAEALGITRTKLWRKMRRYDL